MTATGVRRLPVPSAEPPYDDEVRRDPGRSAQTAMRNRDATGGPGGVQGTLALAFLLPSGLPARPEPAVGLRLVCEAAADLDEHDFGPQPTARAALPAPQGWAGMVVQAIVEVLSGIRPASQLVRWTTADVFDEITSRVLPGGLPSEVPPPRGVVRSVHVSEPADGVAEVCALVRRGVRSTAVALRLEGRDGRWQCTALELG